MRKIKLILLVILLILNGYIFSQNKKYLKIYASFNTNRSSISFNYNTVDSFPCLRLNIDTINENEQMKTENKNYFSICIDSLSEKTNFSILNFDLYFGIGIDPMEIHSNTNCLTKDMLNILQKVVDHDLWIENIKVKDNSNDKIYNIGAFKFRILK